MNENARKIFDMLGVEPNEEFMIEGYDGVYKFRQELNLYSENDEWVDISLQSFINGTNKIIKLPKETKKKKLRDLTEEEYKKWVADNCYIMGCSDCIFKRVNCELGYSSCWINNKWLFSDKFLDQEIEVEE